MENKYSELTKVQLLVHLVDCIYRLYNPDPHDTENDFNEEKETYFLLKEAWQKINGIKGVELFGPFKLKDVDFEKSKSLHQLNYELIRDDEIGKPDYDMLSGNPWYNLPQKQKKRKIVDLALCSCGIEPDKLFYSPLRKLKKFITAVGVKL
ncbi:MAG: hypothetical protein NUV82_01145 [Candidatus Komeilibacteria bacterium]|nr:hypothetical protein [Candidatus Komeilibacteria bacterium]